MLDNRPPVVDTNAGTPAEENLNWYAVARAWVEETDVVDAATDQRFMRVRSSPASDGYLGQFWYVRQRGDHEVDDEVFILRSTAPVGELGGNLIYLVEVAGGGASLPTGQYQYMVFQMVAQNVSGWDWVRAHPDIV